MKRDSDIFSIVHPVSIKYPGIIRVGILYLVDSYNFKLERKREKEANEKERKI